MIFLYIIVAVTALGFMQLQVKLLYFKMRINIVKQVIDSTKKSMLGDDENGIS